MGTNYYWHESGDQECPHCHAPTKSLHVGKSSSGWCFALRVHPAEGIRDLDDWRRVWSGGGAIFDEYGGPVPVPDMLRVITERSHRGNPWTPAALALNHAVPGPNGLARNACLSTPGDGTYDICDYEFS